MVNQEGVQSDGWTEGWKDERLEISPCILQDIGLWGCCPNMPQFLVDVTSKAKNTFFLSKLKLKYGQWISCMGAFGDQKNYQK